MSTIKNFGVREPLLKDDVYYLDFVRFEAEGAVLRVPRYHFTNPITSRQTPEVWADPEEETIHLQDVRLDDLNHLLSVMHPLTPSDGPSTEEAWTSVLHLSSKYHIHHIRKLAIPKLEAFEIPPMKRILRSRNYGLADWLIAEYLNLVKRGQSISFEEAQYLGLSATTNLYQIRENILSSLPAQNKPSPQTTTTQQSSGGRPFGNRPPEVQSSQPQLESPDHPDAILSKIDKTFAAELSATNTLVTNAVERILLARSLGIAQWLRSSYLELARRPEGGLTEFEAERLGLEAAVGIWTVREDLARAKLGISTEKAGSVLELAKEKEKEVERMVYSKFELELGYVRRAGAIFSGMVDGVVTQENEEYEEPEPQFKPGQEESSMSRRKQDPASEKGKKTKASARSV